MMTIQQNLLNLIKQIRECEQKFNREPNSVSLLVVTKKQSIDNIEQAIHVGQHAFGESYVQESLPKIAALQDKQLEWHFIGPIQRNKTRKIAENFDWVQSVDDLLIAKRLNDQRPLHLPPLNICLQVNISQEQTKAGINADDIFALVEDFQSFPRLKLRGLMCIPAPLNTFEEQRASFRQLKVLRNKLSEKGCLLDTLSMGMSDDWQAAVAEGSTLIRIGTAVFGLRT